MEWIFSFNKREQVAKKTLFKFGFNPAALIATILIVSGLDAKALNLSLLLPSAHAETPSEVQSNSTSPKEVPGDPPPPPLQDLLSKPEVQKKMEAFLKACKTRFSIKACNCTTKNFKFKVNGRDVNEGELDMAIAIVGRKGQKKFKSLDSYYGMEDMIHEIEDACVKDPSWEMDLED